MKRIVHCSPQVKGWQALPNVTFIRIARSDRRRFKGSHQGRRYRTSSMALKASKAIVPALVGSMVVSYIFWDLARNRKVFGGTVPRTLTKEWLQETERRMDEGWPTVAGKPVVMNPISRQNYRPAGDT